MTLLRGSVDVSTLRMRECHSCGTYVVARAVGRDHADVARSLDWEGRRDHRVVNPLLAARTRHAALEILFVLRVT